MAEQALHTRKAVGSTPTPGTNMSFKFPLIIAVGLLAAGIGIFWYIQTSKTVSWEKAIELMKSCQIKGVESLRGEVFVILKDGKRMKTNEPKGKSIFKETTMNTKDCEDPVTLTID